MLNDRNKRIIAITFVTAFVLMAVSPALVTVDAAFPSDLNVGPYIDKVVFQVIADQSQVVTALLAGQIEFDHSFFSASNVELLAGDPDIELFTALRNGYGHLTINCRDYPLNISGFRKAIAFALDKDKISSEVLGGLSQSHDSLVPYPNGWCIEDDMPWHYYAPEPDIGNAILDALGFERDWDTYPLEGWRNAPDGTPFDIEVEYAASSPEIAGGTAQVCVDALRALHVNAQTKASDFNEYIARLDNHGNYDIVFYALNFGSNDVDWLAYEFWSELADTPFQNPTNYKNATYDSWRNQLLYSTEYDDVYEASYEMQMILHHTVPRIVAYENQYIQAYRSDTYTGHVPDLGSYITGPWTLRKMHKIDGTPGGTVTMSISQEPDSFNIFVTNSAYSIAIIEELWPSLYKMSPDLTPWPELAESLLTETHADNAAVPVGHTRFTVDIIQNATWNDGTPLTAEDVAFSYTYFLESGVYGNPAATALGDLVSATAPTPYRAVIEFNSESYWHFSNFGYMTIIPKHIFNDVDGIGYANWNVWNPVFDPDQPHVNAGPFIFTDIVAGEIYEISANEDYFYYPEITDTETDTETEPTPTPFNTMLAVAAGAVGAAVVILVGGFVLLRQK